MKKNTGQLLVELGVINTQQLMECQAHEEKTGGSFVDCLIEKKFATQESIAKAYANYTALDYIEIITEKMADLTLLARVPLKFLRDNEVMPVLIEEQLTIVTANPFEFSSLDELNLLLGGNAQYAVAPADVIINSINRNY